MTPGSVGPPVLRHLGLICFDLSSYWITLLNKWCNLRDILNQGGTRRFTIVTHADIRGLVTDLTYMRLGACLFLNRRDHQPIKIVTSVDADIAPA